MTEKINDPVGRIDVLPWISSQSSRQPEVVSLVLGCPWGLECLAAAELLDVLKTFFPSSTSTSSSSDPWSFQVCTPLLSSSHYGGGGPVPLGSRGETTVRDCPGVVPFVVEKQVLLSRQYQLIEYLRSMRITEYVGQIVGCYSADVVMPSNAKELEAETTGGRVVKSPLGEMLADELAAPLSHIKDALFETVEGELCTSLLRRTDSDVAEPVMFRTTALRQNDPTNAQKLNFTQQDFAASCGQFLWKTFGKETPPSATTTQSNWDVNLLYFNTDIVFSYHQLPPSDWGSTVAPGASGPEKRPREDPDVGDQVFSVLCSVVLHEPNLPRMEKSHRDGGIPEQLQLWGQRRKIRSQLIAGEIEPKSVIHSVPGVGHFKNEVRVVKGMNAMHPALGHALVSYARPRPGEVVLDPMGGCGSTLVEALLFAEEKKRLVSLLSSFPSDEETEPFELTVLCGEMEHKYGTALAAKNLMGKGLRDLRDNARLLGLLAESKDQQLLGYQFVEDQTSKGFLQGFKNTKWFKDGKTFVDHRRRRAPNTSEEQKPNSKHQLLLPSTWSSSSEVIRWNAMKLSLRSNSVDIIVSDLPFGVRCGNHDINSQVYPAILKQFWRVLRKNTIDSYASSGTSGQSSPLFDHLSRGNGGRLVVLTLEVDLVLQLTGFIPKETRQAEEKESCNDLLPASHQDKTTETVSRKAQRLKNSILAGQEENWKLILPPFQVSMSGQYPYLIVLDPLPVTSPK